MCVAYPGTVLSTHGREVLVDFGGNRVNARAGLFDINPGDRVLVHAGCVLQVVSEDEAMEIENLLKEMEITA